jgi:Flp pilus assembly protein TadG
MGVPTIRKIKPDSAAMSACSKSRRGAAAVEFALVAPIFLFAIILPMVEFGRAMMVSNSLAAAAQAGCRTGVLPGGNDTAISAAVTNNLTAQAIQNANPVVVKVNGAVANASTAKQGDSISVTVSVPYSNVTWLPISLDRYIGTKTLSSTEVMRRE